jgi:predicted Zn-dependent protease
MMLFRLSVLAAAVWSLSAQVNSYSRDKEAALGAALQAEMTDEATLLPGRAARDYVEHLAARLAANASETPAAWHFEILAEDRGGPTHEPAALPGGYVIIPARLFLAAQDEAEFAAMLAHSMAHVLEHHGTRLPTHSDVPGVVPAPLVFVGGWHGECAAMPLSTLSTRRTFELEADRRAVGMLAAAGYDPTALLRYIQREQPEDSPKPAFSCLPTLTARVEKISEAIRSTPPRSEWLISSQEFQQVQESVRRSLPAPVSRPSLAPSLRNPIH